jgi:hypothetical protein
MTEKAPLDERIAQMLTEARVVLPGVQALLGFQLISIVSRLSRGCRPARRSSTQPAWAAAPCGL